MVNGTRTNEVIVIVVTYDEQLIAKNIPVRRDDSYRGPDNELQYRWYDYMIRREFGAILPQRGTFNITNYFARSGFRNYFMYKGKFYSSFTLIMGNENVYYYFVNPHSSTRPAYGMQKIEFGRCPCCIDKHLQQILEKMNLPRERGPDDIFF